MVVTVNTQYVYTVANDAFLKYHGLKRNEVVGRSVSEVLGEGVFAEIKPQLDQCLAGEIVQAERSRSYRKLGKRYLETRYSPITGAGGEIEGVVGIIRDIKAPDLGIEDFLCLIDRDLSDHEKYPPLRHSSVGRAQPDDCRKWMTWWPKPWRSVAAERLSLTWRPLLSPSFQPRQLAFRITSAILSNI